MQVGYIVYQDQFTYFETWRPEFNKTEKYQIIILITTVGSQVYESPNSVLAIYLTI